MRIKPVELRTRFRTNDHLNTFFGTRLIQESRLNLFGNMNVQHFSIYFLHVPFLQTTSSVDFVGQTCKY